MSMKDYLEAKKIIEANENYFQGPKPEAWIIEAEKILGVKFPPSYRQFLLDFGIGIIGAFGVEGIIDGNFNGTVPDVVWVILQERTNINLDTADVIIGDVGGGSRYALDTRETDADGENPVVVVSFETDWVNREAWSFGEYFLKHVKWAL